MKFEISKELAQSILDFLGKQPCAEVFDLVVGLKSMTVVQEQETNEKEKQ